MSNITLTPNNHPVCASPIEFDFTPTAPLWISEVLIYVNPLQPPPAVLGTIHAGSSSHLAHVTIYVDQDVYDQICDCLSAASVELSIDYNALLSITNVTCIAEPIGLALARVQDQLNDISGTFHALRAEVERLREARVSEIGELGGLKKAGAY